MTVGVPGTAAHPGPVRTPRIVTAQVPDERLEDEQHGPCPASARPNTTWVATAPNCPAAAPPRGGRWARSRRRMPRYPSLRPARRRWWPAASTTATANRRLRRRPRPPAAAAAPPARPGLSAKTTSAAPNRASSAMSAVPRVTRSPSRMTTSNPRTPPRPRTAFMMPYASGPAPNTSRANTGTSVIDEKPSTSTIDHGQEHAAPAADRGAAASGTCGGPRAPTRGRSWVRRRCPG